MRTGTLVTVTLLMAALGITGVAVADDAGNARHKDKKEWEHGHDGGPMSALPEAKRKLLHDTMEKVHKENAPLHEQSRKLHAEMDALMVASQFDSDAYTKKKAELDDLHHKMQDNKQQAFMGIMTQFTQEERVELVVMQHIHKMMKHHHHHWHQQDGKDQHHADNMSHQDVAEGEHNPHVGVEAE